MRYPISEDLITAFKNRLYAMGCSVVEKADETILFSVEKNGAELCQLGQSGTIFYQPQTALEREQRQVVDLFQSLGNVHGLYERAKPFEVVGVDGFRLISELGNAVLAAKMNEDSEVQFVTWEYDYERTGVIWGNYYKTDFAAAKKDFAIRAGIVDRNELFGTKSLEVLYAACVYQGQNDMEMSADAETKLEDVMAQIQYNMSYMIPDDEEETLNEPVRDEG